MHAPKIAVTERTAAHRNALFKKKSLYDNHGEPFGDVQKFLKIILSELRFTYLLNAVCCFAHHLLTPTCYASTVHSHVVIDNLK